jgi:hypothetical protein
MALASPTDSLPGGVPAELTTISDGADRIFASRLATAPQWHHARTIAQSMLDAWVTFTAGDVPPRLVRPTRVALEGLVTQIASRDRSATRSASIDAAYASNDLQLRYRSVTDIDTMRFELWVRRALVDATAGSRGGVRSDVVTLEWIRDRIAHTLDPVPRTQIDALVGELGTAVVDSDLAAAAATARALREVVADLI